MRKFSPLFYSLFFAFTLRISWKLYTHYTYEDAFITFRFAQNLSNGLGFVYNANEHVYGTTTPFFAIIMAMWLKIFPNLIVFGASMFGLLSGLISIVLVWRLLDDLHIDKTQRILAIGVLVLSDKFWVHDMGGMETALVICAMMASYFMLVRSKSKWAGLFAGILLWIRIDGVFWFCILVLVAWVITRQFPRNFIVVAILVYLPWLVFASLYFGSPIPYTISAKLVSYYTIGAQPVLIRIQTLLHWLTPLSLPDFPPHLISWIAALTIIISFIGTMAYRRHKWLLVLPVFCLEEMVRLVVMGETFERRYFMPLFWCLMIVFGFGVHTVWGFLSRRFKLKTILAFSTIALYICISLRFSLQMAQLSKDTQYFVFDSSRKQLGLWLEKNTPPSSTVFLEPLGYIGYYANRRMIDEVGLVSPQVVALKNKDYSTFELITFLDPDYAVLHCDDALRASDVFLARYSKVIEFNPMGFDPNNPLNYDPNSSELVRQNISRQRTACYQVWKK